jgi:hypothetical protein
MRFVRTDLEEAVMDVRAGSPEEALVQRARARWRAAGDRLWSVALADGEEYRRVAELVGAVLGELRPLTPTLERLLALEAEPEAVLAAMPAHAGSSPAGARSVLEAACAVRVDELLAARARDRRIVAVASARESGDAWAILEEGPTRWVEMHLASGLAVVATVDPYSGAQPYALGETVLDTVTGDPVTGHAGRELTFADPADWSAERERWRAEIDERLDGDDPMVSDKR